jgi:predicted MFS family arabinose efflux permease
MGKTLIVIGLVIAGLGLAMTLGVPLGRLPGDIAIRRGHTTFYFPLVTSIVVSLALSLIIWLLRR